MVPEGDALEARSLIYGIVATNLALSIVGSLIYLHATYGVVQLYSRGYTDLLVSSLRIFLSGTGALLIDVLLIIVVYEFISKHSKVLLVRIMCSLVAVVIVDCFVFTTAAFAGTAEFKMTLLSSLVGKTTMATFYSFVMFGYLRIFPATNPHDPYAVRDIFAHLTYRQRFDELADKAQHDDLSGLYNRGYFDRMLDQTLQSHDHVALVFIDIDDFKKVNDAYGHTRGDRVIQMLATTMTDVFRSTDVACRFGGDEFSVILPGVGQGAAQRATERLRERLVEPCDSDGMTFGPGHLGLSIGLAFKPEDGSTPLDLIETADSRLYQAKRTGKNRTVGL